MAAPEQSTQGIHGRQDWWNCLGYPVGCGKHWRRWPRLSLIQQILDQRATSQVKIHHLISHVSLILKQAIHALLKCRHRFPIQSWTNTDSCHAQVSEFLHSQKSACQSLEHTNSSI